MVSYGISMPFLQYLICCIFYFRSKSRSVDHGITSPFDLDALRNKVDNQCNRSLDRGMVNIIYLQFFVKAIIKPLLSKKNCYVCSNVSIWWCKRVSSIVQGFRWKHISRFVYIATPLNKLRKLINWIKTDPTCCADRLPLDARRNSQRHLKFGESDPSYYLNYLYSLLTVEMLIGSNLESNTH